MRGATKGMKTVMGRVREALREREEFDGLIYFCLIWQNPYFWDWDGKGESDNPIKTTLGQLKSDEYNIYIICRLVLHTRLEMIEK